MTNVLIDTNVILDARLLRVPHAFDALSIMDMCLQNKLKGFVSASSITDIYYILQRTLDHRICLAMISELLRNVEVIAVDLPLLKQAVAGIGMDFEDNLQIACAVSKNLDGIVTSDMKGFQFSSIPVYTPAQLLAKLNTP